MISGVVVRRTDPVALMVRLSAVAEPVSELAIKVSGLVRTRDTNGVVGIANAELPLGLYDVARPPIPTIPSAPASDTAAASAPPATPAMGALTTGLLWGIGKTGQERPLP